MPVGMSSECLPGRGWGARVDGDKAPLGRPGLGRAILHGHSSAAQPAQPEEQL